MGLFNETVPTAKFDKVGDSVTGEIVRFEKQHRSEFNPNLKGAPRMMFWVDGKPTAGIAFDPVTKKPNNPVMDNVLVLETGQPDEYGKTERRLFVKGKATLSAVKEACKSAGVQDVEEGGILTCTWANGLGRVGSPKVYSFSYVPPGNSEVAASVVASVSAQANNPFA